MGMTAAISRNDMRQTEPWSRCRTGKQNRYDKTEKQ